MKIMTVRELAEIYGVTSQTILRWCRIGLFDDCAEQLENGMWIIKWSPLVTALMPISTTRRPDGTLHYELPRPKNGRPKGSKGKKPYPKGVKRPRKQAPQA